MSLIRIPALLAILVASGPLQWRYAQQRFVLTVDGAVASVPSWLALVAAAIVFILVAGYRRDRRHSTLVLSLEALIAVLITIVPPLIWTRIPSSAWVEAMGGTTGASFAQMLALVWFLIIVRTLRDQRRSA